jgi:hypothetical protein
MNDVVARVPVETAMDERTHGMATVKAAKKGEPGAS